MKQAVEFITQPKDVVRYLSAPEGSRDWAIGLRYEVQLLAEQADADPTHLGHCLHAIHRTQGWRNLRTEQNAPFESFEEFCRSKPPHGLGLNWRKAKSLLDKCPETKRANGSSKNGRGTTNGTAHAATLLPPLSLAKQACRELTRLEQAELLRWLQKLSAVREGL